MAIEDLPCVIVELSEAKEWPQLHSFVRAKRIPDVRRPVALQPSRQVAEQEARRLAERHPGRRFVVFEPVLVGMTVEVPSHVNLRGEVKLSRRVATVMPIDDGTLEIPF